MEKQDRFDNRDTRDSNWSRKERLPEKSIQKNKSSETIKIRSFDYSDLIEKYKFSLVGRKFHRDGRGTTELMAFMSKPRIWNVEGKFVGTDLGNDRFQMDFYEEEEMQKVLNKRPCHYNRWSLAIERWEPTIREDFPNKMLFWIQITGVPTHYRKDETYRGIGEALGEVKDVDVIGGRVQVFLNGDEPLHFVEKAEFENGDVITVKLKYEDLHRYCFNCFKISHIEGECPEISEQNRDQRRILYGDKAKEKDMSPRHKFSQVSEEKNFHRKPDTSAKERLVGSPPPKKDGTRYADLRENLRGKRDQRRDEVWKRIDYKYRESNRESAPSYRERYHPYERQYKGQAYYDQKRPRYEFSYASSSKQPRFIGEHEVSSGSDVQRGRKSFEERIETIVASDSQRTLSDIRRPFKEQASYRAERNLTPRGRTRGEEFHSKEKSGNDTILNQGDPNSYKLQWRRKSNQSLREEEKLEKGHLRIEKTLESSHRNSVFSESNHMVKVTEKEDQKDLSSNDEVFEDVTPERDPLDKAMDLPPLTTEQEAEIDADMAAMDKEPGMNDEEIDNDDLLEEDLLQDQEKIDAISQLSPGPLITSLITDPTTIEKKKQKGKKSKPDKNLLSRIEKPNEFFKEKGKEREGTKKKIHNSSELKGISFRKSKTLRVRSSPLKKKGPMHAQPSAVMPRTEVFPSASNKKFAYESGSVVSQKPPSTQI